MSAAATLKERLRAGETVLGTFLNLGSPVSAEICAQAGFDWVLIDLEHGSGSEAGLLHELQAISGTGTTAIVRVESGERARIGRALDFGADGVMVPRVDTAAQAAAAVAALQFPPQGARGVAQMNRAGGFGRRHGALADANERVLGVVQIESPEAVANVDEIAAVPGVDVLFVGPSDLSHSLGIPGQVDAEPFRAALGAVLDAAAGARKAAGILAQNADQVGSYLRHGFQLIAVGGDSVFLAASARSVVEQARQCMGGETLPSANPGR